MLLKIEKNCTAHHTTIRLSGRLVASNRPALSEQIESGTGKIILDLEEVTLIDLDIVQFLAKCETVGMQLLHCPPYIREWIYREQERAKKV
jgi:anti-anti-sigma regulatory factor